MKRTFISILVVANLVAGLEMARAQTDEVPVPKPPYLEAVPDYGHWIVKFKNPKASTGAIATAASPAGSAQPATTSPTPSTAPTTIAPPALVSDGSLTTIETIKTGDLRGITLTFSDGSSKEYTCQGDWVLCSTPQGPQLRIASPTSIPYSYYSPGFIFLDGVKIDPSTFKEAAKHNGTMAFHYHSGETDVWIDPGTMLPVGAKLDGVEIIYQFLTPPPRPFPIPKDQESLLRKGEGAYKATSSMR